MADLGLDPTRTAVLAMDFQQGVVSTIPMAQERNVVQKAKPVLDAARKVGIPVIHVVLQFREGHPELSSRNRMLGIMKQLGLFVAGQEETKIAEALGPEKGDIIVNRPRVNAFYNSDLQSVLSSLEVDTLVLMGIATNWVVEATARHAADADYRVIVLEDCCASMSVEAHDFAVANVFGIIADIMTSDEFLANLK
ncbi:cysteine hydrolase family protein [Chloroflexota bacterium]